MFLLRFAWRRSTCFDVLPPGARARGNLVTIAEKRLFPQLDVLKGEESRRASSYW